MDDVVEVIRSTRSIGAVLYGICFGHQIIAHAYGGCVERADEDSHFVAEVKDNEGNAVFASFAHQDHVVDAFLGIEVVASAASVDHRRYAAIHLGPFTRFNTILKRWQRCSMHLLYAETMSVEERAAYDAQRLTTNVGTAFGL